MQTSAKKQQAVLVCLCFNKDVRHTTVYCTVTLHSSIESIEISIEQLKKLTLAERQLLECFILVPVHLYTDHLAISKQFLTFSPSLFYPVDIYPAKTEGGGGGGEGLGG